MLYGFSGTDSLGLGTQSCTVYYSSCLYFLSQSNEHLIYKITHESVAVFISRVLHVVFIPVTPSAATDEKMTTLSKTINCSSCIYIKSSVTSIKERRVHKSSLPGFTRRWHVILHFLLLLLLSDLCFPACTSLAEVTVVYQNGLPVISVSLPSRRERCQFTLKPLSDCVGVFLQQLQAEDRGIDRVAIYSMGMLTNMRMHTAPSTICTKSTYPGRLYI